MISCGTLTSDRYVCILKGFTIKEQEFETIRRTMFETIEVMVLRACPDCYRRSRGQMSRSSSLLIGFNVSRYELDAIELVDPDLLDPNTNMSRPCVLGRPLLIV